MTCAPSPSYARSFRFARFGADAAHARAAGLAYARTHLDLLGRGSDREVFRLSSKRALKVARTVRGEAQNAAEVTISADPAVASVVARVLLAPAATEAAGSRRWVVTELVRPLADVAADREVWEGRIGVSGYCLEWLLGAAVQRPPRTYRWALTHAVSEGGCRAHPVGTPWLQALYRLVAKHRLRVDDLGRPNQYGISASQSLVLLDYGFTEKVATESRRSVFFGGQILTFGGA